MRRRATGISVDVLVRREGAAPMVLGRGAHRRASSSRLLRRVAAAAVAATMAAGGSALLRMSDDGAPLRLEGGDQAAPWRVAAPSAGPPASADAPEPQVESPEQLAKQITVAPRTPAAAPRATRRPDPTQQPRRTRSPERTPALRTPDLELTEELDELETDELAAQLTKRPESSGSRGRKSGRTRGPKG
jgi:hypothetical protein